MRDLVMIGRRLVAVALLFVVAAHAAAPFGQPFERLTGSAFSAATSDVSLAFGQSMAAAAKRTLPANPIIPILAVLAVLVATAAALDGRPYSIGLGATGPPLANASFSPIAPRAPPAA